MNTVFVNSGNSKASDLNRLLLNLSDKINWKSSNKYVALSNLSIYYAWKNIKKSCKNNKYKISAPTKMKSLTCMMDHILHEIFKIILNISLKYGERLTILE